MRPLKGQWAAARIALILNLAIAGCESPTTSDALDGTAPTPIGRYEPITSGHPNDLVAHLEKLKRAFEGTSESGPAQAHAAQQSYTEAVIRTAEALVDSEYLITPQQAAVATEAAIDALVRRADVEPDAFERLIAWTDHVVERFPNSPAGTLAAFAKTKALLSAPSEHFANDDARLDRVFPALIALGRAEPPHPGAVEFLDRMSFEAEERGRTPEALELCKILYEKYTADPKAADAPNRIRRLEQIGKPIEDFQGKSLDGRTIDLSEFKRKVVLIDFWSTVCGPCVEAMPELKRLRAQYGPKGFEILAVNNDATPAVARRFVEQRGLDWPQISEPPNIETDSLQYRFGASFIPLQLVVDRDGKLVHTGHSAKTVEAVIARLVGEGPTPAETPKPE